MGLQFFESMPIPTPKADIYRRLGYRQGRTKIPTDRLKKVEASIEEALSFLELKAVALRVPILQKDAEKVVFADNRVFESKLAARILSGSQEILLMGATSGKEILNQINKGKKDDLTKSVIFDAVASEVTDSCLLWVQNFFQQELTREGKQVLDKRISCGYGDFKLNYQKLMHEILQLSSIGVSITKTFILIPEKSVTAITGIIKK